MYRRRRNGKPVGNWYITIGGRRVSSKTTNRELAGIRQTKDSAELYKRELGLIVPTWDEACLSWQDENPGPASIYSNRKYVAWWTERLTGKHLPEINRTLIHAIASKELGADPTQRIPQNSTANGYVFFVGRIIEHGLKYRPKFIHYPKIKFRERLLKPDEWLKLVQEMDQDELDAYTFLLATGQREGSGMIRFEWSWLDGNTGILPASEMKSDKPHAFPLNRTAMEVIERRRKSQVKHVRLVFTQDGGKPWYRKKLAERLHAACRRAEIPDLVPHGLRHAFTSWLAKAGVPKEIRKRIVSHATGDVHDGYTHLDVNDLRAGAEVIDRVIDAAKSSHPVELSDKSAS